MADDKPVVTPPAERRLQRAATVAAGSWPPGGEKKVAENWAWHKFLPIKGPPLAVRFVSPTVLGVFTPAGHPWPDVEFHAYPYSLIWRDVRYRVDYGLLSLVISESDPDSPEFDVRAPTDEERRVIYDTAREIAARLNPGRTNA